MKKVLTLVSEVKLVSLLARKKGDMNVVVHHILHSPTEKQQASDAKVIDLTKHGATAKPLSSAPTAVDDHMILFSIFCID